MLYEVITRSRAELKEIQLIHQLPDLALNPRRSVGAAIGAALDGVYDRT